MTIEWLISLVLFALLMVGTPGPANLIVMSAGMRWGVRQCLPFITGIIAGKLCINLLLAFGLLALLAVHPVLEIGLRAASAAYLLFLAWRIAGMSLSKSQQKSLAALPGFFAGLPVHPLNPKAWVMLTAAYAQFTTPSESWGEQVLAVCAVFLVVQCIVHPLWCGLGQYLASRLSDGKERALMIFLSLTTVAVVIWALLQRG